ncbi:hypothetical protein ACIQI7_08885 [Kitasatospora sp. NPDC092039]|uniref:hypothetical protein n=1 Tax=Kitasatospora sp. NPDC092039 TaxID=3364086 RepID=UPI0037FC7634
MYALGLVLRVAVPEVIEASMEGEAADEAALLFRVGWPIVFVGLRAIEKGLHRAFCLRRRRPAPMAQIDGHGAIQGSGEGEANDRQRE